MNLHLSGVCLKRSDKIIVFIQTDFPDPVVPAISKWGIDDKSLIIGFPEIFFPIPMLDGGHLMFYAFEKVLGRPLSQKTQEGFFRIGLFLLLSLMFFTTFNDLRDLGLFR